MTTTSSDAVSDNVARDLKNIVHQLAEAGAHIAVGKPAPARELMKQANVALTALRVRFDQLLGPRALPRTGRLPHTKRRR